MPSINWTDEQVPEYSTEGTVMIERHFVDVSSLGEGYQKVPITFDITHFGILYEPNNAAVHTIEDSHSGNFFAPFIHCQSKEELTKRISKLAQIIGRAMFVPNPFVRLLVFRYIDPQGKRYFALGGTNGKRKDKKIHELNIKTLQLDVLFPDIQESWCSVVEEMLSSPHDIVCCEIEKEEIMDFESRKALVPTSSKDVLLMLPLEEGFTAQHFSGQTKNTLSGMIPKGFEHLISGPASIFKMKSIRMASMNDLNFSIKWMAETFRTITGSSKVKVLALYSKCPNGEIDASLISYKIAKATEVEEDEAF